MAINLNIDGLFDRVASIETTGGTYNGRSVNSKLGDILSVRDYITTAVDGVTSNQAGITAAITAAIAAKSSLYWPAGTYVSTGNIPNFHLVQHKGSGAVKRGSSTFYLEPTDAQSNTIYVAATGGSATNDGLSTDLPVNTFQVAFDVLKNYGPILSGKWNIVAAAGTYDFAAGSQTHTTPSKNRVVIRGPDVGGDRNVPTCIIDGGGIQATYRHGMNIDGSGVRVWVQDILAQNFKTASGYNRVGFLFANGADAYTQNLHTKDCVWAGIISKECEAFRCNGGIIDGGGVSAYGIISDSTRSSVGYGNSSTLNGPIIKNTISAGVYWSTGSQGHCDWVTFEDCGVGFLIAENSRCDTVGNNYKRCSVAKRASTGGFSSTGGSPEVFNDGTADSNITNWEYRAYSGDITESSTASTWQRMGFDRTTRTVSGTTPTTIPTVYTIAAHRMRGTGKSCRVRVYGVFTQATAGSTLTVNFGGMGVALQIPGSTATNVPFELDVSLFEVTGGYRAFGKIMQGVSASRMTTATTGFVNSTDQDVSVTVALANAADVINIYRTDCEIIG